MNTPTGTSAATPWAGPWPQITPPLILYGATDGVLNQKRVEAADSFGTVKEIVIEGGNHAYFGDYGPQRGDGAAAITPEEQQQTAADAIEAWIS